ncbi:epidermal growth factor receptor [Melanotaenia boesemani]|uniref:epidermal growth factor receptor n=1 Tax=Melanotaenia boesemani TaxID=1250792 RepID=UPI001C04A365|nr:epidermal growth factor receptor [Melanotaenia boesemani]
MASRFLKWISLTSLLWLGSHVQAEKKVCQGSTNRLNLLGTKDDHYLNMVKTYSNCTVVLENLEITYMEPHRDLSFLKSIEEVGGYVLIALNTAPRIPLENLRIIRGHSLYEGTFALSVLANFNKSTGQGTTELLLNSLTEIIKGGVKFDNNQLCNVETIQWYDIVNADTKPKMDLKMTSKNPLCKKCNSSCYNGSCWTPEHCQTFTKLNCAQQCSKRCRGPSPSDCCNEHCAAGCTGPRPTDCLACRDFQDDGVCKDSCPGLMRYDPNLYQLVPNPHGKYTFGAACVKSCPHNYVVTDHGECVRTCSGKTYEVDEGGIRKCARCEGLCPKVCNGIGMGNLTHTLAINATNIGTFKNCTKINGNVDIIYTSIHGDSFTKTPPMDPGQLDVFKTVKEITGYLWIQHWQDNMSSLSPFENLEIIRGRTKRGSRSLVIIQLDINYLGLRSLKEISDGDVVIRKNKNLCYTNKSHWERLFKSGSQSATVQENSDAATCALKNNTCDAKCTTDGCWGPGPDMCFGCRDYSRDGSCVDSCNILEGEPREAAVNKMCMECHPECQRMNGTATCKAPGSGNCTKCANFQDGLFCVPCCPRGVPGEDDTLVWKYADEERVCQLCHKNCSQG